MVHCYLHKLQIILENIFCQNVMFCLLLGTVATSSGHTFGLDKHDFELYGLHLEYKVK